MNIYLFIYSVLADVKSDIIFRNLANYFNFTVPYVLSLNHGVYIIEKGYKKTVCPDGKYFHQNKLFFIFTLIIFSEHSYFLRKSQITPERKQRKKIFFNSICTPPEHPNSPQSLYLWAFSQFSPLLKLVSQEFYSDNFNSAFAIFGRYIRHIRRHIFYCHKNCTQNVLMHQANNLF